MIDALVEDLLRHADVLPNACYSKQSQYYWSSCCSPIFEKNMPKEADHEEDDEGDEDDVGGGVDGDDVLLVHREHRQWSFSSVLFLNSWMWSFAKKIWLTSCPQ